MKEKGPSVQDQEKAKHLQGPPSSSGICSLLPSLKTFPLVGRVEPAAYLAQDGVSRAGLGCGRASCLLLQRSVFFQTLGESSFSVLCSFSEKPCQFFLLFFQEEWVFQRDKHGILFMFVLMIIVRCRLLFMPCLISSSTFSTLIFLRCFEGLY